MTEDLRRRIAAFGAGVATWEAIVHLSLFVNRSSPTLFGIRLTPRLNAVQTIVPLAFAVALVVYAFRPEPARPRPHAERAATAGAVRDEARPATVEEGAIP